MSKIKEIKRIAFKIKSKKKAIQRTLLCQHTLLCISLLAALLLLSAAFVLAKADEFSNEPSSVNLPVTPNESKATAGLLAQCVGADITKLASHSQYKNCARFAKDIEQYAQKNGLFAEGLDLVQIFTVGFLESGCRLGAEMNAAGESGDGGFFQVDNPCLFKKSCPAPGQQFDEGTKELIEKVHKVKSAGFSGRNANLMYLLSYNRGEAVIDETKERMNKGIGIAEAAQDACAMYYGYPDGKCGKVKCPDPKRFHCNPEGTQLCDFKFYCGVKYPDIGIHYADKGWKVFESMCSAAGGTIKENQEPVSVASIPKGEEASSTAVVAKRKHPLFSVPYSINPAFRTSIPFDFNIYDTIALQMKKLNLCGADIACIVANATLFEAESQGSLDWMVKFAGTVVTKETAGPFAGKSELMKWEAFCEKEKQNIVNSLAEGIDACASSPDVDCMCPYTYPVVPGADRVTFGSILRSGLTLGLLPRTINEPDVEWKKRKVVVKPTQWPAPSTTLMLEEPKESAVKSQVIPGVSTTVDMPSLSNVDVLLAAVGLADAPSSDKFVYTPEFESRTAGIYKAGPNQLVLYYDQVDAPSQKECNVFHKFVKFCVKQEATFVAYDISTDSVGNQNVVVKFAYFLAPHIRDVNVMEVYDAKKAQGAVLLAWDALEGSDVRKYTVYYSADTGAKAAVKGKSTEEVNADPKILDILTKVEIEVNQVPEISSFDFTQEPQCIIQGQTCSVNYLSDILLLLISLEHNKLYYLSQSDPKKYVYLLDGLEDETRYFFAITATDAEDQESQTLTSVADEKVQPSHDDAPSALAEFSVAGEPTIGLTFSVTPVTKNIDGTELPDSSEVFQYKIYCFRENDGVYDLSTKVPFKTEAVVSSVEGASQEVKTEAIPVSCMENTETKQSVNPVFVVTTVDHSLTLGRCTARRRRTGNIRAVQSKDLLVFLSLFSRLLGGAATTLAV
ncbi:hypothetical protein HY772_03545 [Candidatus Woesearchaeota archaeon]|nr:hypothetical protein [Candidatus Woesearchaeota archaeon]